MHALLVDASVLAAVTGFTYTGTVLGVAFVSVASRNPERRRDARTTLTILVRRRPQR
ncbi:hypothetical protein ABZ348_29485 [Streptomyces sp. NPDC005963]|uniref:hypothetical protein n=1 Tax=Streptomyces sp. NPDC005963 TaxID=3156721 RepID=UPI0033C4B212